MASLPAAFREYKRLEVIRDERGLSLEELERWTQLKRILTEHMRPGVGGYFADKQASLRVPIRERAEFDRRGEACPCVVTNISRGNVFITTDTLMPVGAAFALRVPVNDGGKNVELPSVVTSTSSGADREGREQGMGIRFDGLSDEAQAFVHRLYGRAMEEAGVTAV